MTNSSRARVVRLNHVALEVGDIDEALAFYGRLFNFKLRSKSDSMAFIDLGDQFIALQKGRKQPADDGVSPIDGRFLDFRDPWDNRIEMSATTTSSSPRRRTSCAAWSCRA